MAAVVEPEGFRTNLSAWIKALVNARLRYVKQSKALNLYVPLIQATDWTPRPAIEFKVHEAPQSPQSPIGWKCPECGRVWAPHVNECQAHRPNQDSSEKKVAPTS